MASVLIRSNPLARAIVLAAIVTVALAPPPSGGSQTDSDFQTALAASVTVSPSVFPASRDCRLQPASADLCADPRYTSFTLTYVVGGETVFQPNSRIRTTFGYKYKDEYRTEFALNRLKSWPLLQTSDPQGANYVTARVLDAPQPVTATVVQRQDHKLDVRFNNEVLPGARVEITYGDTQFGSPGYAIPAVAYDIDLVVMQDSDNDNVFEVVDTQMPTLSVVGTDFDGLEVVAPSQPEGHAFRIIVKALQGDEERLTNQYLVPGFTGTVTFSSTDSMATLPGDYTFESGDGGVKPFVVTLPSEGVHTIKVTDTASGISGTSNPIVIGRDLDPQKRRLFWGVLQQHTYIGGHASQTPQFAFEYARNISGLDFLTLTEHCPRFYDWEYHYELANSYYEPYRFVTFGGIEWSNEEYGHRHLVYLHPERESGVCAGRQGDHPTIPTVETLPDLLGITGGKEILVIPHHMGWNYAVTDSTKDVALGDPTDSNQRLYEIYSHHGSSEMHDNAPYVMHNNPSKQWGLDKKVFFQDAINLGYKFGVTSGTDNHTGEPGGHLASMGNYGRGGITGVYADELTREGIWEALWARRTYGTTGARIILSFSIDGHSMGEEAEIDGAPEIRVDVVGTGEIATVTVIRDGYDTVYESNPDSSAAIVDFVDRDIESGDEHSYYVRAVQKDGQIAWSSPIWVNAKPTEPTPTFSVVSVEPNPFNSSVRVRFTLPGAARITAKAWSVTGASVAVITQGDYAEGSNEFTWNGLNAHGAPVATGVYFISIESKFGRVVGRAVLIQ